MLESAIETPFQIFAGEELYPTIQAKGTRLGYGLIKKHCMLDGNKRIGIHIGRLDRHFGTVEMKSFTIKQKNFTYKV